jgi:molybdenum cofactor guanylyltransferase
VPGPRFTGYVLCGGSSRRMGRDKALLPIEGVPLARRVADALDAAGAEAVEAVGGDGPALVARGLRHRPDRWPGEGPLGGIVTALGSGAHPGVAVVLSCDLIAPRPEAIGHVVRALVASDADVAVPVVDGRPQWLHAAWDRRVAAIVGDLFAAGERSVAGAALALRVEEVTGLAPDALADADRPEDLPGERGRDEHAGLPTIEPVQVPAIDIDTLQERLAEGSPLIDVRQPEEYQEARAPGARLIPLAEVPDRIGEIPADRPVYVICRSGGRSAKAVEHLRSQGIDAVNVTGGTLAWIEAGNAVETGA